MFPAGLLMASPSVDDKLVNRPGILEPFQKLRRHIHQKQLSPKPLQFPFQSQQNLQCIRFKVFELVQIQIHIAAHGQG